MGTFFSYLISSLFSVLILLPMFSWVSLWISMKLRSKSRSIITTMGVIVIWISAPFLVFLFIEIQRGWYYNSGAGILLLLSPIYTPVATEVGNFRPSGMGPHPAILLSYLWHGGVLFFFRWFCLKNADRYLGRAR